MSGRKLVIAFDTSTESIAAGAAWEIDAAELGANAAEGKGAFERALLSSQSIPARRCANERLLTVVDEMVAGIGCSREDIAVIACGRGPGSFTGVRIGVATAKGAALGLGCTLHGVSTLDAIAWECWAQGHRGRLGVVGDALRKEVYPVRYLLGDAGIERLDPDGVDKPAFASERWAEQYASESTAPPTSEDDELANVCGTEVSSIYENVPSCHPERSEGSRSAPETGVSVMLTGDGLAKFQTMFIDALAEADVPCEVLPEDCWAVTGRGLLLAYFEERRRDALGSGDPQELLPVYTRLSDAEENEKVRKAAGKPMRGVLVNPVDFVEKSDTPEGLDPSTTVDVPASGVALDGGVELKVGGIAHAEELAGVDLDAEHPLILAIESSCDETAAAIVDGSRTMVADVIATQIDFHKRFGGVVPEIASRKHTEAIVGLVEETMERAGETYGLGRSLRWTDLDAIAVTQGPGLIGALVVGMAFAKGLSWATGLPLIGVNHMEGHIYANQLANPDVAPPMVVSLVSGGHTMLVHVRDWGDYEIMGQTLDDAVGEAYDKVAKALGLGYPGGPVISCYAAQGNPDAIDFPRAMLHSHDYRFSLSGLKTAVMTYIKGEIDAGRELNIPDLAASFQRAVVDVQVAKAVAACKETGAREFCLGGGVAANPELRAALSEAMGAIGVRVTLPELSACTDNAGMIAAVALDTYARGDFLDLTADSIANMPL